MACIVPEPDTHMLSSNKFFPGKYLGILVETAYRQLVLCPSDSNWQPASRAELVTILQRVGMLGQLVTSAIPDRFLIGDAFMQLFSFMGCAPSIEFTPKDLHNIDWLEFVFIQLSPAQARPRWRVDKESAKPACPHCQRRIPAWIQHYHANDMILTCPHCKQSEHACRWRWFDAGACARQFVSIVNVFPKESMPTETVLLQLQQETGVPWHYFYLHAPLFTD